VPELTRRFSGLRHHGTIVVTEADEALVARPTL
jgi:hypothetical protein